MAHRIGIETFLRRIASSLVVDVRAPAEFAHGHIPRALNVPLFSNEERAEIGRCYRERGRHEAVLLGLEIVGPKMRGLVQQVSSAPPRDGLLIHCWRGGMRSQSMAWLLEQVGHEPAVLEGGYKRYRRCVLDSFARERQMIVLAGMTGAGKTRLLQQLAELGEQVLDLEGLANHRGSSFGGIGLPPQPTSEQFENEVFERLQQTDPNQPLWVEDESPSIGKVRVPHELWWVMRRAPAIFVDVPRRARARYLAEHYGSLDLRALATAIERLQRKLGGIRTRHVLERLAAGDLERVAYELLAYYDKAYEHAARKRPRAQVFPLSSPTVAQLRDFAAHTLAPICGGMT